MNRIILAIVAMLSLSACGGHKSIQALIDAEADQGRQVHTTEASKIVRKDPPVVIQHSDKPLITVKSIPTRTADAFPDEFSDVTLVLSGQGTLIDISEYITRTTGILVELAPDTKDVPTTVINFKGSLKGLLDSISARMGVNWELANGKITISRMVTRTFTLLANPGTLSFDTSLGKTGQASVGATGSAAGSSSMGSFQSSMSVATHTKVDTWDATEKTIKSMLTKEGKVVVNQATGSITVTDTKTSVAQVEEYLKNENKMLTRQVAIQVEVLSVRDKNGGDFGTDWNLVFAKITNGITDARYSLTSPSNIASSAAAGAIGLQLLRPVTTGDSNAERVSGSQVFFRALSTVARVGMVTTQRAITLNRQPVPLSLTNQVTYLAETLPTSSTSGTTSSIPGLKAGTVTTGFLMNLLPTITDSNSLLLTFSLDMSELLKLNTITSGLGTTQQSIQAPEVAGMQFLQRVAMRTGETLVITGFDRYSGQYDKRGLAKDVEPGLFGSFSGNQTKETLVVLITPVIVEGI